jgi:hypothetical protein
LRLSFRNMLHVSKKGSMILESRAFSLDLKGEMRNEDLFMWWQNV